MTANRSMTVAAAVALLCAVAARAEEIPVGVLHAQTGPLAFVGVPATNGIRLAAEEINASHSLGADTVRLIVADYASDKAQAITLLNRLAIADRALIVLGPTGSIEGAALAPVANDLKVPMFSTAITAEVLKAGPWSFKITAASDGLMNALADYASVHVHCRRVALVFNRDNDGHINNKNVFRDAMRRDGAQIVAEEGTLATDSDFSALGTKIADIAPDCLFVTSNGAQGANIVGQLRQAGMADDVKVFGVAAMATQEYVTSGGRAVDGTFMATDYNPSNPSPENQAFVAAYRQRYHTDPDNWAAVGYTTMRLAAVAIRAAGPNPDRDHVRAALAALKDVPVVLGNGSFSLDAGRFPVYGASVLMARDGRIVTAPR